MQAAPSEMKGLLAVHSTKKADNESNALTA